MKIELHNTSRKLCVIGDPVLHSKSPLIQNTMLAALGLDYIYLCQSVPRGETETWLRCAAFCGYAGFNATMPHKEALVPRMDELDEDARMYGAVNTVCLREGRCYGYNTDGRGFLAALEQAGVATRGQNVLILGAGGAAKAVAPKLCQAGGARQVVVANRTVEKAAALCAGAEKGRMIPVGFSPEELRRAAEQCDLLVNCTNLGMEGTGGQFSDFSFLPGPGTGAAHPQRPGNAHLAGGVRPGAFYADPHRRQGHGPPGGGRPEPRLRRLIRRENGNPKPARPRWPSCTNKPGKRPAESAEMGGKNHRKPLTSCGKSSTIIKRL